MAAPTQPTHALIVAEAFNAFGLSSPSAAQLTRATDYGIEKVKRDIWAKGKTWKTLRTIQYLTLSKGVSRYANPSDFERDLQEPGISILDGNVRDVLQNGAAGTATLAATDPTQQDEAEGHLLAITSGTGADQAEQIDDYNATTKVATMRANWGTTPVTGDGYLVVNTHYPVTKKPWQKGNLILEPGQMGIPRTAFEMGGSGTGYIELRPVPDKVYMMKRDYYANLLMMDIAAAPYNTIVLRNWAGILIQGVKAWIEAEYDDTRRRDEELLYQRMLNDLAAAELDMHNESNLQQRLAD